MIGFVAVNWSLAEQMLDACVVTIYHDFAGNELALTLPRSFSQKIKYTRKAFLEIPKLKVFGEEGLALVDRMDTLSERRNALAHGVVTSVQATIGKFEMARLEYDQHTHESKRMVFDPKAFPVLSQDLLDFGSDFSKFILRLEEAAGALKR